MPILCLFPPSQPFHKVELFFRLTESIFHYHCFVGAKPKEKGFTCKTIVNETLNSLRNTSINIETPGVVINAFHDTRYITVCSKFQKSDVTTTSFSTRIQVDQILYLDSPYFLQILAGNGVIYCGSD
ncbi:hypothetical protein F2P81_011511 [Scophthalmus maximus]|uniref:Uncharacterized protein n=1 Tax=Scophthalmus maximus TaxID=52904 RepID=A0A6A4SU38_SCOMX|nr:hypothetical protein F2P81_011511 [Scophthalmus maximus]